MNPALVFPLNDPQGAMFPHLQAILPALKQTFAHACVSLPPLTRACCPETVRSLENDSFFRLLLLPEELPPGRHFWKLYDFAASVCPPLQVLHLCYPDRLAFALQSRHRQRFLADVRAVDGSRTPLIFQRSQAAWRTHPRNYVEIEKFVTTAGELMLGKSLDFAWCHLALRAERLASILLGARSPGMSMVAEMILGCLDDVQTREVDWLEWEDPFYAACSAAELKRQREASLEETCKRFSYALPMVEAILAAGK